MDELTRKKGEMWCVVIGFDMDFFFVVKGPAAEATDAPQP
jgi:hypothetical protein